MKRKAELVVTQTSSRTWRVFNNTNGHEYYVIMRNGKLECHCLGFLGNKHCQHVSAVTNFMAQRLGLSQ